MRYQTQPTNTPMIAVPVDGEIIKANKPTKLFPFYTYDVLVQLPQGTKTLVTNAASSTLFGGPFDYLQIRRRASQDAPISGPDLPASPTTKYTIGDRVVVVFLAGDMRRPMIIGGMPHPRMGQDLPESDDSPQMRLSYLGMTFDVNPKGEFVVTHRGAALNANVALPVPPVTIPISLSTFKMEGDGSVQIGDAFKQKIRLSAGTSITLGGPLATAELTLAGSIKLDATTTLDASAKLSSSLSAGPNKIELSTVGRSIGLTSTGTISLKAAQEITAIAPLNISLKAGIAGLTMKNGQVALGSPAGEIFDMFAQLLQEMLTSAPTFVSTAVGPGVLAPNLLAKLAELIVKVNLVKGSL